MSDIDVFADDAVTDPYALFAHLRVVDPVHCVPGTRIHLIARWDDVHDAVMRPGDFSSNLRSVLVLGPGGEVGQQAMDGGGTVAQVLATADDPDHKLHRRLLMASLSKRVRTLEGYVETQAQGLWTQMCARSADGKAVDWVTGMADALPISVIAHLIGLPQSDVPRLIQWVFDSTEVLGGLVEEGRLEALGVSVMELYSYLEGHLAAAALEPHDDLLGVLAEALEAGEIETAEAVMMLLQLVGAGGESTSALLGSLARVLAERPDLHRRLRAEPDVLDAFTDEVLRLESPFRGHYRSVVRDCTLGGRALRAGDHLLLLWGSANRDETRFDRADEIDLDRPGLRQHLAFGKGIHFCVGSALARLEAKAALRHLVHNTTSISLAGPEAAVWVPSIFVRRLDTLLLTLTSVTS